MIYEDAIMKFTHDYMKSHPDLTGKTYDGLINEIREAFLQNLSENERNVYHQSLDENEMRSLIYGELDECGIREIDDEEEDENSERIGVKLVKKPYKWTYRVNDVLRCRSLDEFIEHPYDNSWEETDE